MITVIVPAWNEEDCIAACLQAVVDQRGWPEIADKVELIVAVNGTTDRTVALAQGFAPRFEAIGVAYRVMDIPEPSKSGAIRAAERVARFPARANLDADTVLGPDCLRALVTAVNTPEPRFVAARLELPPSRNPVTRAYGKALLRLPYFGSGKTGAGFYAVTAAGRARWDELPEMISDDMFTRGHFAADEIVTTDAAYRWPLPEGWGAIVRARRRQEQGMRFLERRWPELGGRRERRGETAKALTKLAAQAPATALTYVALLMHVKLSAGLVRGRWEPSR